MKRRFEVCELPTRENQETLSIRLDDSSAYDAPGADWYEVKVEWQ